MEPKTPLDSPSLQEERYHAEDTCAGDTDFLYISRTAETYNRIDSLCIEPTYTDHIRSVETDSVGGCVAEYCGFATSFKGYPVEGGILKAIASYARMVEVKKDFTHSNFAENTDAVTVDLSTSKAVTRFQLNSNTHCSSMLESASVNVHDMSILRQYDSKEYADHRSISTMYIEHKKNAEEYALLAVFDSTFSQLSSTTNFSEVVRCSSSQPISVYDTGVYSVQIYHETPYLWGVYAFRIPDTP